jgi:hypothetical protein
MTMTLLSFSRPGAWREIRYATAALYRKGKGKGICGWSGRDWLASAAAQP